MLNRRNLLKGAAVAGVTLGASVRGLLPAEIGEAAPIQRRVYFLSPKYMCRRGQLPSGAKPGPKKTCEGCNACVNHAANKLFAGPKAAFDPANRAHPNCNCGVRSRLINRRLYRRMFGFPGCQDQGRKVFDPRKDSLYEKCAEMKAKR